MKRDVLIWRDSVYHNNFVCSCGRVLAKDGVVADGVLYDTKTRYLYCPRCEKAVAFLAPEQMDVADDEPIMRGLWKGDMDA